MIWRVLGYVWAAPLTAPALIVAMFFTLFRWVKWIGRGDAAFVWAVNRKRAPQRFVRLWNHKSGMSVGQVVILKNIPDNINDSTRLAHECEHVRQQMILGVFYPVLYVLFWVVIKVVCVHAQARYSNPFELEARRAAGQYIDMEGLHAKLLFLSKKRQR